MDGERDTLTLKDAIERIDLNVTTKPGFVDNMAGKNSGPH